jgi:hypothetical protein
MALHAVGVAKQRPLMAWLVRCFRIAAEHGTVFHGFGMTSARLVRNLLRPGLALLTERNEAQYAAEVAVALGISAVAWWRLGRWLTDRHHAPAPPDYHQPAHTCT